MEQWNKIAFSMGYPFHLNPFVPRGRGTHQERKMSKEIKSGQRHTGATEIRRCNAVARGLRRDAWRPSPDATPT